MTGLKVFIVRIGTSVLTKGIMEIPERSRAVESSRLSDPW